MAACRAISFTSQGQTISGTVGAMSFPKVGGRSSAFAIKLIVQGVNVGADHVIFEVGQYGGAIGDEDIGQPDATQLQGFVTEAINKIEGKPDATDDQLIAVCMTASLERRSPPQSRRG